MSKNNHSSRVYVRALAPALVCLLVLVLSACGGSGSSTQSSSNPQSSNSPQSVSVAVSPVGASVQAGATKQYQASVTGSSNTAVSWSVDSVSDGNATVGSISAAGLYTAPGTAGQHTITATSAADATASGKVTVTVAAIPPPPVSVTVSPTGASVQAGATEQFQAAVTGSSNTVVTWSVDGVAAGNATVGSISGSGLYTAPGAAGQHKITATSAASPTATGSVTIIVAAVPPPPVTVTVSPAGASIQPGATQQFLAAVTGSSNTSVTWSIDGVAGGNATVGSISAAGLYTAPGTTGQHKITATSAASPTASGAATLTVTVVLPPVAGDITVDFNARGGGAVIPAGLFGSQLSNLSVVSEMQTLVTAGMSGTRLYANVPSVFATATPNWTLIDPTLAKLQQAGMKATLMIAYTPPWLQPASNACTGVLYAHSYNSAPSDSNAYASIAAQYVKHIDKSYPGLVEYYEIWNEADQPNEFCGVNPGDSAASNVQVRLNEYLALYKPVAIAMKQQAAIDGVSIMVGGPALGNYAETNWISQLVSVTNNGAKLVDFVSYHQYLAGSDVSQTMTWDGTGGTTSLYSRTISGIAGTYKNVAKAAGSAGSAVPVLLDEFNDDWDFKNTCCKNSPTYSPVWNTMVFSLLLNTSYSGTAPIQHLSYYSASNQPFCLLGYTGDPLYGCGTAGTLLPYPQFRAFELLASPNFLDLQANGGNLAKSVANSTAMNSAGLVATAFYTAGSDGVVLVNPKGTAITNAALVIGNPGLNNPTATQYLLDSSTYSPTNQVLGTALSLAPTSNGAGVQTTVTMPPYSVIVIKVVGH